MRPALSALLCLLTALLLIVSVVGCAEPGHVLWPPLPGNLEGVSEGAPFPGTVPYPDTVRIQVLGYTPQNRAIGYLLPGDLERDWLSCNGYRSIGGQVDLGLTYALQARRRTRHNEWLLSRDRLVVVGYRYYAKVRVLRQAE